MTLQQMVYFQVTARHSHITHAARELYISQPSLSVALKNLEAELGVALFERFGQGIRLTRAGQRFLTHVERILSDVDRARLEMEQLRRAEGDSFTIGYISPLANEIIAECIGRLAGQPELEGMTLCSVEMTTSQAEAALMSDAVDAALCSRISDNSELSQIPVLEQPLVLIAARNHPLATRSEGRPVTSEDVAAWPFVTYQESSTMIEPIRRYFQAHPPMPVVCHRASTEEGIAALVERGMGLAIVAQTSGITRQRLALLPLEGLEERRTIYLTWRTHRRRMPAAEAALKRLGQR
ncbi:MAG: LysR family transcriptional regulator [Clostridia bacterium]|nr:LysR family transcriptional regulator [Clostridia bacterium]